MHRQSLQSGGVQSRGVQCSVTMGGLEFRVCVCVRGQQGERGQSREGVECPDSLMEEAVPQSAGPGPETLQSPP